MQCCLLAGKYELRVTHISAMNKILTVKEKMGEGGAGKSEKEKRSMKAFWKKDRRLSVLSAMGGRHPSSPSHSVLNQRVNQETYIQKKGD